MDLWSKCMNKWKQKGMMSNFNCDKTALWVSFPPCSKMFDIELCPLPFSMEEMFGFISCRFSGYPASVQEQALLWLHVSSHTQTHSVCHGSCSSVHCECELNSL